MSDVPDDFYIGYETGVPRRSRRVLRWTGGIIAAAALGCAAIVTLRERPFPAAWFAFGESRSFQGRLVASPYPALEVRRDGDMCGLPPVSRYLLVGQGKHALTAEAAAWIGRDVTLSGSLIGRHARSMIQVDAGSLHLAAASSTVPDAGAPVLLGRATLRGEIVDGKCYLGVMSPGEGASHRDCAERCIHGGIPPLFAVRTDDGRTRLFTLASSRGGPLREGVRGFVGVPLEISGTVLQHGDDLVLRADPDAFRRIHSSE